MSEGWGPVREGRAVRGREGGSCEGAVREPLISADLHCLELGTAAAHAALHCIVHCLVDSVHCTVFSVHCKVYSVQSTVYSIHGTMHSVHCTRCSE